MHPRATIELEVDGGVGPATIKDVVDAGSAVFKGDDYARAIAALRAAVG